MAQHENLVTLQAARRIWVVGAIHGDASRLYALHDQIADRVRFGDRLVYSGNFMGIGTAIIPCLTELLTFRRWFLSMPPYTDQKDVVYLRGAQEEMWQKLLQLQFSQEPLEVLDWISARGVEATIKAYGGNLAEGRACAQEGAVALTRWTSGLAEAMHHEEGHDPLLNSLAHAALTRNGQILICNSGLDIEKSLSKQGDAFWWAGRSFSAISKQYGGFAKLVRGYDPDHSGFAENDFTLTIDGGCGFGGPLMAACLDPNGQMLDLVKV